MSIHPWYGDCDERKDACRECHRMDSHPLAGMAAQASWELLRAIWRRGPIAVAGAAAGFLLVALLTIRWAMTP